MKKWGWERPRRRRQHETDSRIQEACCEGLKRRPKKTTWCRAQDSPCGGRHNGRPASAKFSVQTQDTPSAPHAASNASLVQSMAQALASLGLLLRGGFQPLAADALPLLPQGQAAGTLLMVGNAGPAMWRAFSASPQAHDGQPHPLNRWTRQQVDAIARAAGGVALYPFDATPVWPFQRWAARAEPVFSSPLGLLIHPQYGLWHAYRAAILVAPDLQLPAPAPLPSTIPSPCASCADQPCLSTCPVSAFGTSGYDVAACASHLALPAGRDCLEGGCLARRACPVGVDYAQAPAQNGFHMLAFFRAVRG